MDYVTILVPPRVESNAKEEGRSFVFYFYWFSLFDNHENWHKHSKSQIKNTAKLQRPTETNSTMADKVEGTVKWFSNRKGFGFITPSSDNAPTKDDIFVHQSNIVTAMDTYRTLKDGFEVQFEVITDTNGKLKAENVTSADGSPCPGPEPRERRKRKKNKASSAERGEETAGETPAEKSDEADDSKPKDSTDEAPKGKGRRRNNKKKAEGKANNENNNNGNNAEKPQPKPSWENDLEDSVKESLESRKIKIIAGKAFLAIGDARVKLGNGG